MLDPTVLHVEVVAWPLSSAVGVPAGLALLAPEEQRRAQAIRHPEVAVRFVAGRVGVRTLLAPLLDCAPHAVPLRVEADGRPVVDLPIFLPFSVSHTRHVVTVAYARAGATDTTRLGVDVEDTARTVDQTAVARRALHDVEWAAWHSLADDARAAAFWRLWTTKEAVLKAVGAHVAGGLQNTRVAVGAPTRLLSSPATDPAGSHWHTRAWAPWPATWLTVAARHNGPVLLVLRRATFG